jgi:hypothetical protein
LSGRARLLPSCVSAWILGCSWFPPKISKPVGPCKSHWTYGLVRPRSLVSASGGPHLSKRLFPYFEGHALYPDTPIRFSHLEPGSFLLVPHPTAAGPSEKETLVGLSFASALRDASHPGRDEARPYRANSSGAGHVNAASHSKPGTDLAILAW